MRDFEKTVIQHVDDAFLVADSMMDKLDAFFQASKVYVHRKERKYG